MSSSQMLSGSEWQPSWQNVHAVVEDQIKADGFHIWPFNPLFPVDVRSFLFGRKHAPRLTRHDYFELLYVYSGEAEYQVQDHWFTAKEGDLLVINGSLYHRLRQVQTAPFRAIVLYFLPEALKNGGAIGEDAQYLMPFLLQDAGFPHLVSSSTGIPPEVLRLISKINSHLPATNVHGRLTVRTCLEMIMVLLIDHYKNQLTVSGVFDRRQKALERLRQLFDYVDGHYSEPIPLSKATEIVRMSKAHFMRSFKRVTGQPFDAYVNQFRICKAQSLLASTDLSISEVGREVGFGDQSYFGLVFRRLTQLSPREYRKSLPDHTLSA